MQGIIEVRIRESGSVVMYDANGLVVKAGDYVIMLITFKRTIT